MVNESILQMNLVWLVALQFLLYAVGWGLSSLLLREDRRMLWCWGGFMACVGLGFVFVAQRGEVRTWLAFSGSGIAFLGGMVLLWVGLRSFFQPKAQHREPLFTFVAVSLVLAALGSDIEHGPVRVVLTHSAIIWVVCRIVQGTHPLFKASHGRRVALIMASPALLVVAGLSVPLARQLLNMGQPMELHRFDATNVRVFYVYFISAAVFNFAFMALVIHRLLGRLRELSHRDPLTGLANRRAVDADLQREWHRWRRSGQAFSLMVVDLDHFKRINDSHGHPVGDEVLVHTARRLQSTARALDVVARVGGEEFLVLLPATPLAGAHQAGQRLLQALAAEPMATAAGALPVTASVGVAEVAAADADVAAVLARADQALYRAKAEGRDRVISAV